MVRCCFVATVCLSLLVAAPPFCGALPGGGEVTNVGRGEPRGVEALGTTYLLDTGVADQRAVKYAPKDNATKAPPSQPPPRTPEYVHAMERLFTQVKAKEATDHAMEYSEGLLNHPALAGMRDAEGNHFSKAGREAEKKRMDNIIKNKKEADALERTQKSVFNSAATIADGMAAHAAATINATEMAAMDNAATKATKLRGLIRKSKEIEAKNSAIRIELAKERPDSHELTKKVREKQSIIESMEDRMEQMKTEMEETLARGSPAGRAAIAAAEAAGAKERVPVTMAAIVMRVLTASGFRVQQEAKSAGYIVAASMMEGGASASKAAALAEKESLKNGATEDVALEVRGTVIGDYEFSKGGDKTKACEKAATAIAAQGGEYRLQAAAAGAVVQRAGGPGVVERSGSIAALIARRAGANAPQQQQAAAFASGLAAAVVKPTPSPTLPPTRQPTATPTAMPTDQEEDGAPTASPTPAPTASPTSRPTGSPTHDGLLMYAQDELAKQRAHIKRTIEQIKAELRIGSDFVKVNSTEDSMSVPKKTIPVKDAEEGSCKASLDKLKAKLKRCEAGSGETGEVDVAKIKEGSTKKAPLTGQ